MKRRHYKKGVYTINFFVFIGIMIISLSSIVFGTSTHGASFRIPERLVYDLTWAGIKAGTASLEVQPYENRLKIISTAQSAQWVSVFYTVNDRIESTLYKNPTFSSIGQPEQYRVKIREGRHRRDKEVIFDLANSKALYKDYLKNESREFQLPPFVFDPVSSFFYLRTRQLVVGKSTFVSIFDSKKVWNVEVQVLRNERITIPMGTFNTIVVKPLMKSEGIFYSKGEIFIWLTDDEKHIPVKLQSKVAVGHITATLVAGYY